LILSGARAALRATEVDCFFGAGDLACEDLRSDLADFDALVWLAFFLAGAALADFSGFVLVGMLRKKLCRNRSKAQNARLKGQFLIGSARSG
jgi:hypothetical protein